jgi:hypothetical protein
MHHWANGEYFQTEQEALVALKAGQQAFRQALLR